MAFFAKEVKTALLKRGDSEQTCPPDLAFQARRLFQLQEQAKLVERDIKAVRDEIDGKLDPQDKVVLPGECQVMKVTTARIEVTDADGLRRALGERFDDLVHVSTSFKLENRLKDMMNDDADAAGQTAKQYVQIKHTHSLRCTSA